MFACHAVDNPSAESEMAMLRKYGPDVSEESLKKLSSAFGELRNLADQGLLNYPYSTRELVNVVKHLQVRLHVPTSFRNFHFIRFILAEISQRRFNKRGRKCIRFRFIRQRRPRNHRQYFKQTWNTIGKSFQVRNPFVPKVSFASAEKGRHLGNKDAGKASIRSCSITLWNKLDGFYGMIFDSDQRYSGINFWFWLRILCRLPREISFWTNWMSETISFPNKLFTGNCRWTTSIWSPTPLQLVSFEKQINFGLLLRFKIKPWFSDAGDIFVATVNPISLYRINPNFNALTEFYHDFFPTSKGYFKPRAKLAVLNTVEHPDSLLLHEEMVRFSAKVDKKNKTQFSVS